MFLGQDIGLEYGEQSLYIGKSYCIIADLYLFLPKENVIMKYTHHERELEKLIGRNGILSVKDFSDLYSGVPMTSVYAYIRRWVKEGKICFYRQCSNKR